MGPSPRAAPHVQAPTSSLACPKQRRSSEPTIDRLRDPRSPDYVVVARRYRPQLFADLVGTGTRPPKRCPTPSRPIACWTRLSLFTGARGVGKTSAAQDFSPRRSIAKKVTSPAALQRPARFAEASAAATTWTFWKSTGPATAASTRFASCGKTSTFVPAGPGSRSTSSTKSTC